MRHLRTVLAVAIALLLWQFAASGAFDASLIPPPTEVSLALLEMVRTGELVHDVLLSIWRVLVGFAIGSVAGTCLGLLTGRIRALTDTLGQIFHLLRPIPVIAMVPLALVWFGI